jgi:hypothetical protein
MTLYVRFPSCTLRFTALGLCSLLGAGLAPEDAAAADPIPVAETPYQRGLTALKAKNTTEAIANLSACAADPASAVVAGAPDEDGCVWQLGWAYWLQNDWAKVVTTWEPIERRNPSYQTLARDLAAARAQIAGAAAAEAARANAPATIPPRTAAPTALRLRAVGDLMFGTLFPEGALAPDDAVGTFDAVRSTLVDADLTFGNLEGPLCDNPAPSDKCKPDAKPGSCYAFRSPTRYAPLYTAAGFDAMSTANNHAGDFGDACRIETEQALDAQGIRWSGRAGTTAEWVVNGKKVALVGFHTNIACNYVNDTPAAVALVQQLVSRNDIVIVSFHGGAEGSKAQHVPVGPETFYGEDRGDLRTFTHAVVDAGADLVLGHGPHVLRGMEIYKDRLIAYSMGNFATYGRFNLSGAQGVGEILEVGVAADGSFTSGRIFGTVQVNNGRPVPDPKNQAADLVRALSAADFPEHGAHVALDGTFGK